MNDSYLTVRNPASGEILIQKSRFIGYAAPCNTEDTAQQFIRDIREKHRDARHHCYAYIIGINSGIMRYSDDGEPGGTAGMPIMDVLKNEKLVNCCVVVVRYFGGVLLGTGGLVRAYTQGCKLAVQSASIVRMELSTIRSCRVSYADWSQIQYVLQQMPVKLDGITYTDTVEFILCSKCSDADACKRMLDNLTAGRLEWMESKEKYLPWTC